MLKQLLLLLPALLFGFFCNAQSTGLASDTAIDFSEAQVNSRYVRLSLEDPEELELALKNIHTYRSLQRLRLEGTCDQDKLSKLMYRLSVLKNLNTLEFIDNDLNKLPDNITVLKFLRSLSIQGSVDLNLNEALLKLKAIPISTLNLLENDLVSVPENFAVLSSLQRLQISGSNQLDYSALMTVLKSLPNLSYLALPFNYITDLPENISQMRNLKVLDVSENNLFELPAQMSALRGMNQFNIHGNLLIDPVRDLEKLKDNAIRYLSLDNELSDTELEQIKKIFPDVQIDFPLAKKVDTAQAKPIVEVRDGNLKVQKSYKILSPAYMVFAGTMAALRYNFDTLTFDQRYLDLRYVNVRQKVANRNDYTDCLFLRNKRFWREVKHPKNEIWFVFGDNRNTLNRSHSELRAFAGMYWVYSGALNKKQFSKLFVVKKRNFRRGRFEKAPYRIGRKKDPIYWNDVRINFSANNSMYTITLKSDTGYTEFTAYPRFANTDVESSSRQYYRRFNTYQRGLLQRKLQFQKQHARDKARYDAALARTKEATYMSLRLMMSNDERRMTKQEWLEYYDGIIAKEKEALDNSALQSGYIMRYLNLAGYNTLNSSAVQGMVLSNDRGLFDAGYRLVNLDIVNKDNKDKLAVVNAYVIDEREHSIRQYQGTAGFLPTSVWLKAFAGQVLLVELRNGNWAMVSAEEINAHELLNEQKYTFKASVYDRNLDKIKSLLSEIK